MTNLKFKIRILKHYYSILAELFKRNPQNIAEARAHMDAIVQDSNTNHKAMIRNAVHSQLVVSMLKKLIYLPTLEI